ncbi:MAG: prepilin-type N-terminal cleavage/methylation domain-containing protein [Acidovorax sp.]|nr:prepilin-type N-terminal cleavage/methylation domain-containing protein [Acidovorax sp.]
MKLARPKPADAVELALPGHWRRPPSRAAAQRGFTLLELLVVVSIMALATAGVGLALRDSGQTQLEREGERLAALLESARAQSRASGAPVRWRAVPQGFRFDGLPPGNLPSAWLDAGTQVRGPGVLVLGPEPLIGPQQVVLGHAGTPGRALRVATDGLRPFAVEALP